MMTLDQKEKFRRILQCLSNGKLEMGRMDLQKALEYFSLAHSRAAEYADFIKINDIDKEPVCQKCMSGERVTIDPAPSTFTMSDPRIVIEPKIPPAAAPVPLRTGCDFSWALLSLIAGNAVKRAAWAGKTLKLNDLTATDWELA